MNDDSNQPGTHCTSWLVWSGLALLMFAGACLVAMVVGMMWTHHSISTSLTAPTPADLARGISNSLLFAYAAVPIAMLGIVFIFVGFIRRQPA